MSSSHTTSILLHVHDEAEYYSVTSVLHEYGRTDAHAKNNDSISDFYEIKRHGVVVSSCRRFMEHKIARDSTTSQSLTRYPP